MTTRKLVSFGRSRSGFRGTPNVRTASLVERRQVALSQRIAEIHDPRKLAPTLQQVLERLVRDVSIQLNALERKTVSALEVPDSVMSLPDSEPSDESLSNNQVRFWYDSTGPTIEVKHRDSSGTVRSGTVASIT